MHKGVCSAFTLKMAMAGLMLLDHIYHFLPPQPEWFTWLGRLVAPVFCYLMAESFAHTRNRARYIARLGTAGLVMLAGNMALQAVFHVPIDNSILLSLALSAALLGLLEWTRGQAAAPAIPGSGDPSHVPPDDRRQPAPMPLLLRVCICAAGLYLLFCACLFVEGGPMLPVLAVVFYYLRGNRLLMCAAYLAAAPLSVIFYYRLALGDAFTLATTSTQMLMVFAVLPILLYNGERGPAGVFAKWFFYAFYPLHIWGLYLVSVLR